METDSPDRHKRLHEDSSYDPFAPALPHETEEQKLERLRVRLKLLREEEIRKKAARHTNVLTPQQSADLARSRGQAVPSPNNGTRPVKIIKREETFDTAAGRVTLKRIVVIPLKKQTAKDRIAQRFKDLGKKTYGGVQGLGKTSLLM